MKVPTLAGALLSALGLGVTAAPATAATPVRYDLSLGDSLSVGYQPNPQGVGIETSQGYADDLYTDLGRQGVRHLKLVKLGCPGDTTTSLLTGRGNASVARAFHCNRTGGSQLAAAVRFLKAHHHPGEVPYLTLDIGANDVDNCAGLAPQGFAAVETCVGQGISSIQRNTPKILAALRRAAPRGTRLAAMNLYDPVLADELSSDPNAQQLGQLSLGLVRSINTTIARADRANGFWTADVADAFVTYDTSEQPTAGTVLAISGASQAPSDVIAICTLTWRCAPSSVGPNIHANVEGYRLIADTFDGIWFRSPAQ